MRYLPESCTRFYGPMPKVAERNLRVRSNHPVAINSSTYMSTFARTGAVVWPITASTVATSLMRRTIERKTAVAVTASSMREIKEVPL